MEVLAQKKRGLPWMYIMSIVSGVMVIAIAAVVLGINLGIIGTPGIAIIFPIILMVTAGIAIIVIGIVNLLKIKRSPDCITLNGNQVDLGNGYIVNINQITDVDYREARARYSNYRWGTLTVYVDGQKLDYHYIDDVRHARDRIMQFILQSGNPRWQVS